MQRLLWRGDFWFLVGTYILLGSFINGYFFELRNEQLPVAILLFSLFSSSLYAYWFLLLPITKDANTVFGAKLGRYRVFQASFFITLITSVAFFYFYCYLLYQILDPITYLQEPSDTRFLRLWKKYHLLLFAGLYTVVDMSVMWSDDANTRNKFKTLILMIDMPIVVSMLFITFGIKDTVGETNIYYFEAGVLSFQYLAGSLASVVLDTWEIRIRAPDGTDPNRREPLELY